MKIHLLSGFLGSGKTTAIQKAAALLLERGVKTGVISNDQGTKLVDGSFFKSLAIPHREVINGCFCCNYQDLDTGITSLIETNQTATIFAESVGSCTDIIATVLKPLIQFRKDTRVTVSVFADVRLLQMMLSGQSSFDAAVQYIYMKQLDEAGILIVSKIDLISTAELVEIKSLLQEKYNNAIILYLDLLNKDNVQLWLQALDNYPVTTDISSLHIDYDTYAAGEAAMGWLDQELEIFSNNNNALRQAEQLINGLYQQINNQQYPIGHLKFLINHSTKISFTAGTANPAVLHKPPAVHACVLINMRVQASPDILAQLVAGVIEETQLASGCRIVVSSQSAFQPGYPRPAFRL